MKINTNNIALIILFSGMALILIGTTFFGNEEPVMSQPILSGKQASYELCKLAILRTAHDPESVSFKDVSVVETVFEVDTRFVLNIPVRAKNRFNALRLSTMQCSTEFKNGKWALTGLKLMEE